MEKPLILLTKVLLGLWAVITILAGLLTIFYEPFATTVAWPPPLEPVPAFHARLNLGPIGIGTGLASAVALAQNRWAGARPLIALYVAYAVFAEYAALTRVAAGPVPIQLWLYVLLGGVYLVGSIMAWVRQQAA